MISLGCPMQGILSNTVGGRTSMQKADSSNSASWSSSGVHIVTFSVLLTATRKL